MKTRLLIIIDIVLVGIILIVYVNSVNDIMKQECLEDGGAVTGLFGCMISHADYDHPLTRYDSPVLECLTILYHCDITSEYFEECISAKKDGITIEELCSSSDIVIEDGCITVDFVDGNRMISCG